MGALAIKRSVRIEALLEAIEEPAARREVEAALKNPDIGSDRLAAWVTKHFGKVSGQTILNYRESLRGVL